MYIFCESFEIETFWLKTFVFLSKITFVNPLTFFRFEPSMYQESVLCCLLDYSEALEANFQELYRLCQPLLFMYDSQRSRGVCPKCTVVSSRSNLDFGDSCSFIKLHYVTDNFKFAIFVIYILKYPFVNGSMAWRLTSFNLSVFAYFVKREVGQFSEYFSWPFNLK